MKKKTLTLEIYSDIHLEFGDLKYKNNPKSDVVIMAGDIGLGLSGIEWIKKNIKNKPVIYVAGNHEFYHQEINSTYKKLKKAVSGTNIHFLENDKVTIDGVSFLGCTLWTDFNLYGSQQLALASASSIMNDYIQISQKNGKIVSDLLPEFVLDQHKQSIDFLNKNINPGDVVITHHAPHINSTNGRYSGQYRNLFYASDLSNLILEKNPQLWIHGHCHSKNDYDIGKTNIVSNPRGYVGHEVYGLSFDGLIKKVKK